MRVVYFGTPPFSAQILWHLSEKNINVVGIVTQPDRPKGRALKRQPSAVKEAAEECFPGIPVFQPQKASSADFLDILRDLKADLFVVVAFGQILSEDLLTIPSKGCINVHTSLLPKYRGAAPIQRCLLAGEKETGVSIQKMVKALDAGDVIATDKMQIPLEMNCGELEKALCELSKPLLVKVLKEYAEETPMAERQNPDLVTFAAKITAEDGEIFWDDDAEKIHNQVRGLSPRPGAWSSIDGLGKKMKILSSSPVQTHRGIPGELLSSDGIIACGKGAIQLKRVQPEGKKEMSWSDWLRGNSSFSSFKKN